MPKYLTFDIIHHYGAAIRIAIPDGVENAEAVAEMYLNDLEYKGLLDVQTDYLETYIDFAEYESDEEFERAKDRDLYILEPTLEELEPFADAQPLNSTHDDWVSVEDCLPLQDARLLVYTKSENQDADGIVNIDNYSTKYGFACERDNKNRTNKVFVTHWKLITKP